MKGAWKMGRTRIMTEEKVLRCMFVVLVGLSLNMLWSILIFPMSWLAGHSKLRDNYVDILYPPDGFLVPKHIVNKYAGHTAVQLTHILPGAVWAGVIPFQLHKSWRNRHRRAHRLMGYAFFICSLSSMVGLRLIVKRGLLFENYFEDAHPSFWDSRTQPYLVTTAFWFSFTGLVAFCLAIQRKFAMHQIWVIRHIGAGIWVSVQRILVTVVLPIFFRSPVPPHVQRMAFGESAKWGILFTVAASELAIYLTQRIEHRREKCD